MTTTPARKRPDISMSRDEIAAFLATQSRVIVVALDAGAPVGTVADLHFVDDELAVTLRTDDPVGRLGAACRAFRDWSLAHRREFQLVFASAADKPPLGHEGVTEDLSFGAVFLGIFVEIWQAQPFAVPDDTELPDRLVRQLRNFSSYAGGVLPLGALAAYLSGWVRLYGGVTIEVFGHLGFALDDPEPMFEAMLADMRRQLTTPPTG